LLFTDYKGIEIAKVRGKYRGRKVGTQETKEKFFEKKIKEFCHTSIKDTNIQKYQKLWVVPFQPLIRSKK